MNLLTWCMRAIVLGALFTSVLPAQARTPVRVLTLTSASFVDGGDMPTRHAQSGRDVSPTLTWSGVPDSVRSFVLVVHDVDAAQGDGTDDTLHWLVWNIPATATGLAEGLPSGAQLADGTRQISVSGPYYRGPAAPASGPPHHYAFELYALDITLTVPPTAMSPAATREAIMRAMAGHVRAKGAMMVRYRRPAP